MSSTLGSPPTTPPTPGSGPARAAPAPARRASAPGWRDPRLWVGIAIVAASVLVGARVLAGADDTVAVWAVADDVVAGQTLAGEDLVAQRVRFAEDDAVDRYFTADATLPEELFVARSLGAGELLPRAALGPSDASTSVEISLPVDPLLLPPSVVPGSVVDVYLSDRTAGQTEREGDGPAIPALDAVTVVAAPSLDESFAVSGDRQVVLAVEAEVVGEFYGALDVLGDPVVSIVRRG